MKTRIHIPEAPDRGAPERDAHQDDDVWGEVASLANVHILEEVLKDNVVVQQWLTANRLRRLFIVSETSKKFGSQFVIRAGKMDGATLYASPASAWPTLREIRDSIIADLTERLAADSDVDQNDASEDDPETPDRHAYLREMELIDQIPSDLPLMPKEKQREQSQILEKTRNQYLVTLFQNPYILQKAMQMLLGIWIEDPGYAYMRHLASSKETNRTEETIRQKMEKELPALAVRIQAYAQAMESHVTKRTSPHASLTEEGLSLAQEMSQYPFYMKRINAWMQELSALHAEVKKIDRQKDSPNRTRRLYGPTEDDELAEALEKLATARWKQHARQVRKKSHHDSRAYDVERPTGLKAQRQMDLMNLKTMLGLRRAYKTAANTYRAPKVSDDKKYSTQERMSQCEEKLLSLNEELPPGLRLDDPLMGLDHLVEREDRINQQLSEKIESIDRKIPNRNQSDILSPSVETNERTVIGHMQMAEFATEQTIPRWGVLRAAGESRESLMQRVHDATTLWMHYEQVRWDLVMGNSRFVRKKARKKATKYITAGQLFTAGIMEMLEGADRFEYGEGREFLTFAGHYAINGFRNLLHQEGFSQPLKDGTADLMRRNERLIEEMMLDLEIPNPTPEQVAEYVRRKTPTCNGQRKRKMSDREEADFLSRKRDQVERLQRLSSRHSINRPISRREDAEMHETFPANTGTPLEILLQGEEDETPKQSTPQSQLKELLIMAGLTYHQAELVLMSKGAHPDYRGRECSIREMTEILGTGRQTISVALNDAWSQIHNAVFLRMTHRDQLSDFLPSACLTPAEWATLFGVHGLDIVDPLIDGAQRPMVHFAHYLGDGAGEAAARNRLYEPGMSKLKTGMMFSEFGDDALCAALRSTALKPEECVPFFHVHGRNEKDPRQPHAITKLSDYIPSVRGAQNPMLLLRTLFYEPVQIKLYTALLFARHTRSEIVEAADHAGLTGAERRVCLSFHGIDPNNPSENCAPMAFDAHGDLLEKAESLNKMHSNHYRPGAAKMRRALGHGDTIFEK